MGSTDFAELRMAHQFPLDLSGADLRTEAVVGQVTGTSITVSESGGDITFGAGVGALALEPGAVIRVSGTGNATIDGDYRVSAKRVGTGTPAIVVETPAGKQGLSGTVNVTISNLLPIRETGENFVAEFDSAESEEKVPTRGTSDLIREAARARGSISGELSFPNWTHQIDSAFQNHWTRNGNETSSALSVTFDAGARTASGTGIETGISVRDCIRFEGAGLNAGRVYIVTNVATGVLTLTGDLVSAETASYDIRLGDRMVPGSVLFPYTVERRYTDGLIAEVGAPRFVGMCLDTFSFSGGRSGRITVDTGWLGALEVSPTPTSLLGVAGPRSIGDVLSVSTDAQLWISGINTGCTTGFSMSFANNLFEQNCWGSGLGATDITTRTLSVTGQFSRFYADKSAYNRFLADNDESLVVTLKDADQGITRVFDLTRVKYSDASRSAGARNNDVEFTASFNALISSETEATCVMWGFDA